MGRSLGGEADLKVYVRIRPINSREKAEGATHSAFEGVSETSITLEGKRQPYSFNGIFEAGSTQEEVYKRCGKQAVDNVFDGFNSTIIAYGQTGAGKSYTMLGQEDNWDLRLNRGIIPRAARDIFDRIDWIQEHQSETDVKSVTVEVSYLEVYIGENNDLLMASAQDLGSARLFIDPRSGKFATPLPDLSTRIVTSHTGILDAIAEGNTRRKKAATAMNAHSSRGHSILSVDVKKKMKTGATVSSKLVLVDLAGSEDPRRSKVEGQAFDEAVAINLSLSKMGNIFAELVKAAKHHKLPPKFIYQGEELTKVLANSMGGNSKTILVAAVSPASDSLAETGRCLEFALRASKVKSIVTVDEQLSREGNALFFYLLAHHTDSSHSLHSDGEAHKGSPGTGQTAKDVH